MEYTGEINSNWDDNLSPEHNSKKVIYVVKSEAERIIYKAKIIVCSIGSNIKKLINNLKTSFESLSKMLLKFGYKREYYSWSSIKRMARYILDNTLIQNMSFIINAVASFRELIQSKGKKGYTQKLEEFKLKLRELKNKFYTEIYESNHEYDDTIVKITNTLG